MSVEPVVQFSYAGDDFKITKDGVFVSLMYEETLYGGGTYAFRFQTGNLKKIDRLMNNETQEDGTLRWGFSIDGQDKLDDVRAIKCNMSKFFMDHFHLIGVTLRGTCAGFNRLWSCREDVYKKKPVSDIAKKIAEENDLESDVTGTKEKYTLWQCGDRDWEFLRDTLLPLAATSSGRADYYLYVDKGKKLCFKTPDVGQSPVKRFVFSRDNSVASNVLSLTVDYDEYGQRAAGSRYTQIHGFDPKKKEVIEYKINDDTADFKYVQSGTKPKVPSKATSHLSVVLPDQEEYTDTQVRDAGRSIWSRHARQLFTMSLVTYPVIKVNVGEVVYVSVVDKAGATHFLSGNYLIAGIVQSISPLNWTTTFKLERRAHL